MAGIRVPGIHSNSPTDKVQVNRWPPFVHGPFYINKCCINKKYVNPDNTNKSYIKPIYIDLTYINQGRPVR